MSIGNGVSSGAPKVDAATTGHGAAKTPADTAARGGFASLLLSLGADDHSVPLLPDGGASGLDVDGRPLQDMLADDVASETVVDPALLGLVPVPGGDPAEQIRLPLATGLSPAALPPAGGSQAAAPTVPELVTGVPTNPVGAEITVGTQGAHTPGVPVARAYPEAPVWTVGRAQEASEGQAETSPAVPDVQPLLRQAGLAQRLAQQRAATADMTVAPQVLRGEDVAARLGWQIADATSGKAEAGAWFAAWSDGATQRPGERRGDRMGARVGAFESGPYGAVAATDGPRMGLDVPTVAPDGGLTTEMRVAEQVSYHLGRGAQSAELEVEGIDERPIHVSIDLQGQEARIEFRAEQAQTRQVLQDAMPHLRELLEREGLTLAGMSVGSSGAQGGQEQSAGRERASLRQGQVEAVVEGAAPAAGARGALPSGRTLDLYV